MPMSHGIGAAIHTALLDALQPEWASLLAMPGNDAAQRLYHRLGYRYAGPYRAGADGPVLEGYVCRDAIMEAIGQEDVFKPSGLQLFR